VEDDKFRQGDRSLFVIESENHRFSSQNPLIFLKNYATSFVLIGGDMSHVNGFETMLVIVRLQKKVVIADNCDAYESQNNSM
jgi:hypothetical protein